MKKILFWSALSTVLLTACTNSSDIEAQTGTDPVEPAPVIEDQTLETVSEGDFSFIHRLEQGDYFVDVLYKDEKVGEFFQDLPEGGLEANQAPGYRAFVLETTSTYAYLALEPTGLSGYLPFLGPWEVARVNLAVPDFKILTVNGLVEDIASDDSKVASSMEFTTGISVMNVTQALYPNGSNVTNFPAPDEFNHAGGARFSDDGTQLAYVALSGPENETSAIYVVDLATSTQTELVRQSGQLKITGWDGDMPTYE